MKEIYDLDLGETYYPPTAVTGTNIMRVPGGWIFNMITIMFGQYDNQGQYMGDQHKTSSIFIPYSDEFRKTK